MTTPKEIEQRLIRLDDLRTSAWNELRASVIASPLRHERQQLVNGSLKYLFEPYFGTPVPAVQGLQLCHFLQRRAPSILPTVEAVDTELRIIFNPRLRWLLFPSEVLFPGVHVRVYSSNEDGSFERPRSWFLAESAVQDALKYL